MALINRVAVSNFLNYNGPELHREWFPTFRFECLDFRGQSAAINLTNGGGKTTLAEAILAVLSRDQTLVTQTKRKFSPKSEGIWSHVQVELIRPSGSVSQNDFITAEGNAVAGEHWVFGMCGFRGDESVSYYYYPGRLDDLPIGAAENGQRTLTSNEAFTTARKAINGLVWGARRSEWETALTNNANLQQATIQNLVSFQKEGGQDKSALLFKVRQRRGESYAAAFFYQILAPAIMEGVMDREAEEGEIRLEDTVERAVFSTVRAKIETANRGEEVAALEAGVNRLGELMKVGDEAEQFRKDYEQSVAKVQAEVYTLTELVEKGRLPGVPCGTLPEGVAGEVARHLVLEPGETEPRFLDRALAVLLAKEPKHINELANRNHISGRECAQVIEIPCDLFLQERGARGNKPKSYSLDDARSLLGSAQNLAGGRTREAAIGILEDVVTWFDRQADTNPYRIQIIQQREDRERAEKETKAWDEELSELTKRLEHLRLQKTQMEANEAKYNELSSSGLFSDKELAEPVATGEQVRKEQKKAHTAMKDFGAREESLRQLLPAWEGFTAHYGSDTDPAAVLEAKEEEKERHKERRNTLATEEAKTKGELEARRGELHKLDTRRNEVARELEEFRDHRADFETFETRFGNVEPKAKEREVNEALRKATGTVAHLELEREQCREGATSLEHFQEAVSAEQSPAGYLEWVVERRQAIAIDRREVEREREDKAARRSALDREAVAAKTGTREALEYLDASGLTYLPLHKAVEEVGLTPERKRQVLAAFSGLLFAPVLDSAAEARRAAEALAERDAQVPVLLADSFAAYCQHGLIEEAEAGTLQVGTVAGVVTWSVECLLDPERVEREKARLDEAIDGLDKKMEDLDAEAARLSDKADTVKLARRAAQAEADNEPARLEQTEAALAKHRREVDELKSLTGDEWSKVFRRAQVYVDRGGRKTEQERNGEHARIMAAEEKLDAEIAALVKQQDEQTGERQKVEATLDQLLPNDEYSQLKAAAAFIEKSGPAFVANAAERRQELDADVERADARAGFGAHFEGAQTYVDNRARGADEAALEAEFAEVGRRITAAQEAKETCGEEITRAREALPPLQNALNDMDRAAIQAIRKYRAVAQLSNEIRTLDVDPAEEGELLELADNIAFSLNEGDGPDSIQARARQIQEELEGVDIERKAQERRRLQRELQKTEQTFTSQAVQVGESAEGLKQAEREVLKGIQDARQGVGQVRNLFEGVLMTLRESREKYETCARAEADSRRGVSGRLSYLIELAAADLQTLKKVAGKKRGGHDAHFKVEAETAEREDIQALIDGVLKDVELRERHRQELAEAGADSKDDDDFHNNLRELIREQIYRKIFTKPKVSYVNAAIRGTGDENDFNEHLSEGQKAALSLMWTIRLAEFNMEREGNRLRARAARKKAWSQSENIILVDGLFSNLSDRELINSAMAGIEDTRGRFQLVGLIHNPQYQNDYTKFPVFIVGKMEEGVSAADSASGKPRGWVRFEDRPKPEEVGALRTAQIRRIPAPAK